MLQKLCYLCKEMGVAKNGAWHCVQDTTSDCAGHFPLACSGKCRCGASTQQTLPGCTDDSTECQSHLYGRVIQGWFMTTVRRRLSRERARTVSSSQIASEKMNLIHTKLWPPRMPIMPWSLETGSCLARPNGGGLNILETTEQPIRLEPAISHREDLGRDCSYLHPGTLSRAGEMQQGLLFSLNEHVLIRREASQRWGQWKEKTQLDRKSITHEHLSPGSFLHPFPSL